METPDIREWLTTSGLGSYAGGTVRASNTRRYHGLLSRVDATVTVGRRRRSARSPNEIRSRL